MITIRTNFSQVAGDILKKLQVLKDKEYLLRPVALDAIDLITKRIHEDGKASDGNQIGTYSAGYMKVRTGALPANYTKGKNKGKPRPRYNRTSDTKVIIALTSDLEKSYAVIATEKGYGVGFLNSLSFDKVGWVEETYKKKIFDLTSDERDYVRERLEQLVNDALNS